MKFNRSDLYVWQADLKFFTPRDLLLLSMFVNQLYYSRFENIRIE